MKDKEKDKELNTAQRRKLHFDHVITDQGSKYLYTHIFKGMLNDKRNNHQYELGIVEANRYKHACVRTVTRWYSVKPPALDALDYCVWSSMCRDCITYVARL